MIDAQRVSNVALLGPVAAARVPSFYAAADAAAVLLRDLPIFTGALPTKLLEAMAAATPVLLAARGESAHLVAGAGAGAVVAPGSVTALADAIRALAADPANRLRLGRAGRVYADAHFGADRAGEAWAAALTDAVAAHRGVSLARG